MIRIEKMECDDRSRFQLLPRFRFLVSRAGSVARWAFHCFVACSLFWSSVPTIAGSTHPFYRRHLPKAQSEADFTSDTSHIDLHSNKAHLEPYGVIDPVAQASSQFDARAAAAVRNAVGIQFFHRNGSNEFGPKIWPEIEWVEVPLAVGSFKMPVLLEGGERVEGHAGVGLFSSRDLLEMKWYGDHAPTIYIPRAKCLALMAYIDFFPDSPARGLRSMVSAAILEARSGWCGTFGPGVDAASDLLGSIPEGNYNMSQMHLLQIVYSYYDELSPEAREHLIKYLLAEGRIHRPGLDDHFTSGGVPADWRRAGFVVPGGVEVTIGETENHILTIMTARYLSNQLLYQREPREEYDNRRNGFDYVQVIGLPPIQVKNRPHCTELVLTLLQRILRDDFSEYNAKPYQTETRFALLNLCTYAYDHEVRLAARMVLDYISAHVAVSSSDLRRLTPFRRRNEGKNVVLTPSGAMNVGLLDWQMGADHMVQHFALQAGNTRAFESPNSELLPPDNEYKARPWDWAIANDGGDMTMEAISDYRIAPSIHDLFVNDLHRRFFQRLHRVPRPEEVKSGRNCDNMEIYAGSPSYLISAGGGPAPYAVDPYVLGFVVGNQDQQIGVAVTTSFMPTGQSAGANTQNGASDLIQFSSFSDVFSGRGLSPLAGAANYGVAPDFACGHQVYLPPWCLSAMNPNDRQGRFDFVNKRGAPGRPGFYLALFRDGSFTAMEAFDTWLHPEITFDQFKQGVWARNANLSLRSNIESQYTTHNGNRLTFVIWNNGERDLANSGAKILRIEYGAGDPWDGEGDAGNISDRFLSGTIMTSPADAVVEVHNPGLNTRLTLDMHDLWHPRRVSEAGEVEEAGANHEVWVDFGWTGRSEGDFFRPFNSIAAAIAAVAPGGVIKIMPGSTREKPFIDPRKRIKLVAPIGEVHIGLP